MQQEVAKYQATYFNPQCGKQPPLGCETAMNKNKGFLGPFVST